MNIPLHSSVHLYHLKTIVENYMPHFALYLIDALQFSSRLYNKPFGFSISLPNLPTTGNQTDLQKFAKP